MTGVPVRCRQLVKIFRSGDEVTPALSGLDLDIEAGELIGVIGPSGCGKTTLLHVIGGLLSPTSGSVAIGGQELAGLGGRGLAELRRSRMGFVWQDPGASLVGYLSARRNVELPQTLAGAGRRTARARATELLGRLDIGDLADRLPSQLSGGQQMRVAVAVALANQPDLVLADEPTAALDSEAAARVYTLLRDTTRELGATTVIVSHDRALVDNVDRVVELRDGRAAAEHRPDGGAAATLLVDRTGRVRLPDAALDLLPPGSRAAAHLHRGGLVLRPIEEPDE
ncbi:MAG: ABC transporter ATP-binding protein [Actinomycetota bacterium]